MFLDALRARPAEQLFDASYKRTLGRIGRFEAVLLFDAQWKSPYTERTGFNVLHITTESKADQLIRLHQSIDYQGSFRKHIPRYITSWPFKSRDTDLKALVFSYPPAHPWRKRALEAAPLSDMITAGSADLVALRRGLESTLEMLREWAQAPGSRSRDFYTFGLLLERLPNRDWFADLSPVPLLDARLSFDLRGVPALPNPLLLISEHSVLSSIAFSTTLGLAHGRLTCGRLINASPIVPIDLSFAAWLLPTAIDYAMLELDVLLRLVPPTEDSTWANEWSTIPLAIRHIELRPDEAKGRLTPSALALTASIRRAAVGEQPTHDSITSFWLSSIYAGLTVVSDPWRSSAERLAATLYAAIALEQTTLLLNLDWPNSIPCAITWPGFRAWRTLIGKEDFHEGIFGYAFLVGAGRFTKDGKIDQLPQVSSELDELGRVLYSRRYKVYSLIDENFTRSTFEAVFSAIKEELIEGGVTKPVIVCFCGHGVTDGHKYYLLTGESTLNTLEETAVDLSGWLAQVADIGSANCLVLVNTCYSGQALSSPLAMTDVPAHSCTVLTSTSHELEKSYMLRDDPYSIFISVVLEGLAAIQLEDQSQSVRLFDLLEYVVRQVPLRAAKIGKSQNPRFMLKDVNSNFKLI